MATTAAIDPAFAGHAETVIGETKTGFFDRLLNRLIAAREIEARRKVAIYMSRLPEAHRAEFGMGARDIELHRHGVNMDFAG